jgi:hypothetical protein
MTFYKGAKFLIFFLLVLIFGNTSKNHASAQTQPPSGGTGCSDPLAPSLNYRSLKSILEVSQQLGPQPGFVIMVRAAVSAAELRKALEWLKERNFISALNDHPGSDIERAEVYFNVTQSGRAKWFLEINNYVRQNQSGKIEKVFLDDVKKLMVAVQREMRSGYQLGHALDWEKERLTSVLEWLVGAKMIECQTPERIDLGNFFYVQPSLQAWAKIFPEFAVSDEIP